MVRVFSMLQLLPLVLLLTQSGAFNEECRELQDEVTGLETNMTRITEQEIKIKQLFVQCQVST